MLTALRRETVTSGVARPSPKMKKKGHLQGDRAEEMRKALQGMRQEQGVQRPAPGRELCRRMEC